ncbi:uncharacterized protein LOC111263106 isoform X1 [Varroa jacobsoni]|uniref:uncharacterized protein LOC111263106 isoform X1 n=1 Tax=Varroa jacobsoni TaxID=62625 RepID=UPI000BF5540C|nr:uncharacterized protein LOC111263106 isoform X1 [Varroa jacobsoni]
MVMPLLMVCSAYGSHRQVTSVYRLLKRIPPLFWCSCLPNVLHGPAHLSHSSTITICFETCTASGLGCVTPSSARSAKSIWAKNCSGFNGRDLLPNYTKYSYFESGQGQLQEDPWFVSSLCQKERRLSLS